MWGVPDKSFARGSNETCAYLPLKLRNVLISTRPWSLPISLVPVVLAICLCVLQGLGETEPEESSDTASFWAPAARHSLLRLDQQLLFRGFSCLLGAFLVHIGANLLNTYQDYFRGVDTPEHADDRGLVDNLVSPRAVVFGASCCLASAAALLSWLAATTPAHSDTVDSDVVNWLSSMFPDFLDFRWAVSGTLNPFSLLESVADVRLLGIACFGGTLAVGYSLPPLCLKYRGLGEIAIFLCFGPCLVAGTSQAVVGFIPMSLLAFSALPGMHAASILFSNNTRDIQADTRAGICTLAMMLGPAIRLAVYNTLVCTPIVVSPWIIWWLGHPQLCLMPLLALPWALYVCRLYALGRLDKLPQKTAQLETMFGALLISALLPSAVVGRLFLGCLFCLGGINNILKWSYCSAMVHEDMSSMLGFLLPRWLTSLAFGTAVVLQLIASVTFIGGIYPRASAAVLVVFLVPVTLTVHDFWTVDDDDLTPTAAGAGAAWPKANGCAATQQPPLPRPTLSPSKGIVKEDSRGTDTNRLLASSRSIPTFPTEFDNEFVHFFKNVGMLGGLVVYIVNTS